MVDLNISFKIKNYKCFRDEFVGFDKIKPVNIIIGRNNSGKSSMLDILPFFTDKKLLDDGLKDGVVLQIEDEIQQEELISVFQPGTYGGGLTGSDLWNYHGRMLSGLRVSYEIRSGNVSNYKWLNPEIFKNGLKLPNGGSSDLKNRQNKGVGFILRSPSSRLSKVLIGIPEFVP